MNKQNLISTIPNRFDEDSKSINSSEEIQGDDQLKKYPSLTLYKNENTKKKKKKFVIEDDPEENTFKDEENLNAVQKYQIVQNPSNPNAPIQKKAKESQRTIATTQTKVSRVKPQLDKIQTNILDFFSAAKNSNQQNKPQVQKERKVEVQSKQFGQNSQQIKEDSQKYKFSNPKFSSEQLPYQKDEDSYKFSQYNQVFNDIEEDISEEGLLRISKRIFPYNQPYENQIGSMKAIINVLKNEKNLLFQSPTGTGKTLVTICSALAYLENKEDTQILFLTRTTDQINEIIKEIRKIKTSPDINKYAILAGRAKFCLKQNEFQRALEQQQQEQNDQKNSNDQQSQVNLLNQFCNQLKQGILFQKEDDGDEEEITILQKMKNEKEDKEQPDLDINYSLFSEYSNEALETLTGKSETVNLQILDSQDSHNSDSPFCEHYQIFKKINGKVKGNKSQLQYPKIISSLHNDYELPDIEDVKELFEKAHFGCPFYYNRLAVESAKIVFATYNYVLKQNILNKLKGLFKKNLIIIFDEGHNIAEQAEQESKIVLKQEHVSEFQSTLFQLSEQLKNNQSNKDLNYSLREVIKYDIKKESQYFTDLIKKLKESQQLNELDQSNDFDIYESSDDESYFNQPSLLRVMRKTNKKVYTHSKYNNKERQLYQNFNIQEDNTFIHRTEQQYDLYDQISRAIHSFSLEPNMCQNQKVNQLIQYISDLKQNSIVQIEDVSALLAQYEVERYKEINLFLNSFQSNLNTINDITDKVSLYLNANMNKKLFCDLFYEKRFTDSHMSELNLTNIQNLEQFLFLIKKTFGMLAYLKQIIIQGDKPLNVVKPSGIFVVEDQKESKFSTVGLDLMANTIKLRRFSSIWYFYKKLLEIRKEQEKPQNPQILLDHYLSLQIDKFDEEKIPFLEIGCLSASALFKQIYSKLKIKSLVLTSGTLEPFELIENSLNLVFQKYSSPHIINSRTNLYTQFISEFNKKEINFSYKYTQNKTIDYNVLEVINSITSQFTQYTNQQKRKQRQPNKSGIVIFFKNYSLLDKYSQPIYNRFSKLFYVYKEPQRQLEFQQVFQKYKENILNNHQNCIFLAVNRGKLSEGIDLKDRLCRAVIMLGVPYPSFNDPFIVCKRKHARLSVNENKWYEKVTANVVNQSAGRCIRHKDDWGCIFFIDQSYSSSVKDYISKWVMEGQKEANQTLPKFLDSQI